MATSAKMAAKKETKTSDDNYEYAGFCIRLAAKIIDLLITWGLFLLMLVAVVVAGYSLPYGGTTDIPAAVVILVILLYFAFIVFTWAYDIVGVKVYGRTIGKKLFRLKVVSTNDEPITWGRSILRALVFNLGNNFFYLPALWIIWGKKQQGLHDLAANTYVVREK